MATIQIADKPTLDEINVKTGVTSDTGGSTSAGTIMAKLNAIITNTITNNTESATGNISQKCTAIFNYVKSILGATGDGGGTSSAGSISAKCNAILNTINSGVTADNTFAGYGTTITLKSISSAVNYTKNETTIMTFTAPFDGEYRIDFSATAKNSSDYTGNSTSYSSITKIRIRPFNGNSVGSTNNILETGLDQMFLGSSDPYIYRENGYIPAKGSVTVSGSSIRTYLRGGVSYAVKVQSGSYDNLSGTMNSFTIKYVKV